MIPVRRVPEPAGFAQRVRQPGRQWLSRNPGAARPPAYWDPFRKDLAEGFSHRCGYLATYCPSGTVDHFVSYQRAPERAYDWDNYRYADPGFNSSKRTREVIDPYEVQDGWFIVQIPSLLMMLTAALPNEQRVRAEQTVAIANREVLVRQRALWLRLYREGKLTWDGLYEMAPLIARAVKS